MKEKLLYFRIKDDNINVLLYTLFENYNGNADYIKIYAAITNEVNEVINTNFDETLHAKIRNVISLLGRGDSSMIELLNLNNIPEFTIVGKPFAIPKMYVDKIQSMEQANRQQIDDGNVSYDITQDVVNTNGNINLMSGEDNLTLVNNPDSNSLENNVEKSDEFVDVAESINDSSFVSENMMENSNSGNCDKSIDINIPTDTNAIYSEKEIDDAKNLSTNGDEDGVSIEELEHALGIIQKYVERVKKQAEKSNSKSNIQTIVGKISQDENLVDEPIVQDNIFPDNFFESSSPKLETSNVYVANTNVVENGTNVVSNNPRESLQEPVVMPDNFIGKNEQNFSMGGMSPSTLDENGDIFKFVA